MKKIILVFTATILFSACNKENVSLNDNNEEVGQVKKAGVSNSIHGLAESTGSNNRSNNPNLNELKLNLDIIARSLIDLTNNQCFKDIVASESKTVSYEENYEVSLEQIEISYNNLGNNLLQDMTNSLENNNGTSEELDLLPTIYKGFRLYGNHNFETTIFTPLFDEQYYNQILIQNNTPEHISFNQAFDKDEMPSYQMGNPPIISNVNEEMLNSMLTWLLSARSKDGFGNPDVKERFFEKCHCTVSHDGQGGFNNSCGTEGGQEFCGRSSFGRCRGSGCADAQ